MQRPWYLMGVAFSEQYESMNRTCLALLLPLLMSVPALHTGALVYKLGVPAGCACIVVVAWTRRRPRLGSDWFIVAAFLFSMVGDVFLSTKGGRPHFFAFGIAAFFCAHLGYCGFAGANGRLRGPVLTVLALVFLPYYGLALHPAIVDPVLRLAVVLYLLISIVALALACGLQGNRAATMSFASGIALLVISDTLISFDEFLDYRRWNILILPTYYLGQISITGSLLARPASRLQ